MILVAPVPVTVLMMNLKLMPGAADGNVISKPALASTWYVLPESAAVRVVSTLMALIVSSPRPIVIVFPERLYPNPSVAANVTVVLEESAAVIVIVGDAPPETVVETVSLEGNALYSTALVVEFQTNALLLELPLLTVSISRVAALTAVVESDNADELPTPSSITFNDVVRAAASDVLSIP